jgi:hypothetical protein
MEKNKQLSESTEDLYYSECLVINVDFFKKPSDSFKVLHNERCLTPSINKPSEAKFLHSCSYTTEFSLEVTNTLTIKLDNSIEETWEINKLLIDGDE